MRFEGEEHGVVEGLEGGVVGLGGDEEEVEGGAVGAGEGDEPFVLGEHGAVVCNGRGAGELAGEGGLAGDLDVGADAVGLEAVALEELTGEAVAGDLEGGGGVGLVCRGADEDAVGDAEGAGGAAGGDGDGVIGLRGHAPGWGRVDGAEGEGHGDELGFGGELIGREALGEVGAGEIGSGRLGRVFRPGKRRALRGWGWSGIGSIGGGGWCGNLCGDGQGRG